jgi:hypothetical protein
MGITGIRKVYERYSLTDVIEEELRLIHLGLESSLDVIINELCYRSIEKHLDSDLLIAEVSLEPHPLMIIIVLQGQSSVSPGRQATS